VQSVTLTPGLDELVAPLVNALVALTSGPGQAPTILIAHQTRAASVDDLFFKLLHDRAFVVKEIPHIAHHPEFHHPLIRLFAITRRTETY
jgi:hypothetical protein